MNKYYQFIKEFREKENTFNFAGGLLVFYIALSGNFLGDLFSKELRTLFEKNRHFQHILGFITMLMSITYVSNISRASFAISITALLYLWFLLTTKLSLNWNLTILFTLLVNLFIHKYAVSLENKKDPEAKKYKNYSSKLFWITVGTTFLGSTLFLLEKKQKFGKKFSISSYLFKLDK